MRKGKKKTDPASFSPFSEKALKARTTLVFLLFLSLALFIITTKQHDWKMSLGIWTMGIITPCLFRIPLLNPLKKMGFVFPFVAVTMIIHAFFTPGTLLFHWGGVMLTREGLENGLWVSHKIAFLFWISFVICGHIPENTFYQWMGTVSRFPGLRRSPVRLWIITLFLLLRWLILLPVSWKTRLSETLKGLKGKRVRLVKGIESLPEILKRDILELDSWIGLLILRGYAEGVLWIADNRVQPWQLTDWFLLTSVIALWIGWGFYLK